MALTERFDDALQFASRLHMGSNAQRVACRPTFRICWLCPPSRWNTAATRTKRSPRSSTTPSKIRVGDRRSNRSGAVWRRGRNDRSRAAPIPTRSTSRRGSRARSVIIARLASAPYSVRLVVAADKLHNAHSVLNDYRVLGESSVPRFTGGREGTLWFYRGVAARAERGLSTRRRPARRRSSREIERTWSRPRTGGGPAAANPTSSRQRSRRAWEPERRVKRLLRTRPATWSGRERRHPCIAYRRRPVRTPPVAARAAAVRHGPTASSSSTRLTCDPVCPDPC